MTVGVPVAVGNGVGVGSVDGPNACTSVTRARFDAAALVFNCPAMRTPFTFAIVAPLKVNV